MLVPPAPASVTQFSRRGIVLHTGACRSEWGSDGAGGPLKGSGRTAGGTGLIPPRWGPTAPGTRREGVMLHGYEEVGQEAGERHG